MSTIFANGIRQFYRREGDPNLPVLVLAHPIGFDHGLWDAVVPHLTKHFNVIRYDLRGHGATEVTVSPYSIEQLSQDLLQLLKELGIGRFSFAGTSLGGLVGLYLAIHSPNQLDSLVVANASARIPLPKEEWNRRIELATTSGNDPFLDGMRERMFSSKFRSSNPAAMHTLLATFRTMESKGYAAAMAALRDADFQDQLSKVHTKTLIIAGEDDPAVPRDHSQFMADGIAGARLVLLPGGHLSAVESPVEFALKAISHLVN